jgi:hypothetical protein
MPADAITIINNKTAAIRLLKRVSPGMVLINLSFKSRINYCEKEYG